MQILFENGDCAPIELIDSPIYPVIFKMFKHLQHVSIPQTPWHNPYYIQKVSYNDLAKALFQFGQDLEVTVNLDLCVASNQKYFNYLHKIYEKNYNGDTTWLKFHEHIHMCESYTIAPRPPALVLDYKEKSGLLEKKFEFNWINLATTKLNIGDVYITWAELGKSPYNYWLNNEPNDINRLYELAKPWLILKPQLFVSFEQSDALQNKKIDEFNVWWNDYKDQWCQHWNIPNWNIEHMHSSIVIGKIKNFKQIDELSKTQIYPIKIQL